jgi:hypothetical protein
MNSHRSMKPCIHPSIAAFLLAACATDTPSSTGEPTPRSASAAVAEPAPPTVAAVAPTPDPAVAVPTPAPPPAPPAPANAEPAQLRPSVYGRCRYIRVSKVDDQTFLHYRVGATGWDPKIWVHRIDGHGAIAETLTFAEPYDRDGDSPWFIEYTSIYKLLGHWPDQLLVLAALEGRESDTRNLYRRVDDGWKRVETLGHEADIRDAWTWHDGSILAWSDRSNFDDPPNSRLAVMRGAGKGPSDALLRKRSHCKHWEFRILDAHVQADGKVLALVSCGSIWLGAWAPDDLEGTAQRVGPDDSDASLHIDARGQGFIRLGSDLLAWDGTTATPIATPNGRTPEKVFVGRDGEAWILQGRTLSRRTADGWEPVAVPEGSPVIHVAGLEHGTPWLLHEDDTVSMQTADGAWHPVPLPPAPDLQKVPRATQIHVLGPGDAWVEGKYFKLNKGSKHIGKPYWAAFTTRDAPTPLECGKEAGSDPTAAEPAAEPTTERPAP